MHVEHCLSVEQYLSVISLLFCQLNYIGKSDPFVVVHLLPTDLFPKVAEKNYKTDVKKQTLEPFFNEKFNL